MLIYWQYFNTILVLNISKIYADIDGQINKININE